MNSAVHQATFRALGFAPRFIDVKDFPEALRTGAVDAQENPLTNMVNFKVHETHRYLTMTAHFYGVTLVLGNRARIASWPKRARDALQEAVAVATEAQQVIGDRTVAPQPLEKQLARLRIDEEIDLERPDLAARRVGGETEHQLEERVGEERRAAARVHQPDVDAFVHRLEQAREGFAGEAVRCRDGGVHRERAAVW